MNEPRKAWFVFLTDHNEGPFAPEELALKLRAGELDAACLAWKNGMPDWLPISAIPELANPPKVEALIPSVTAPVTESALSLAQLLAKSQKPADTAVTEATPPTSPPKQVSSSAELSPEQEVWMVRTGEQVSGLYSLNRLKVLAMSGQVTHKSTLWRPGWRDFQPMSAVPALASVCRNGTEEPSRVFTRTGIVRPASAASAKVVDASGLEARPSGLLAGQKNGAARAKTVVRKSGRRGGFALILLCLGGGGAAYYYGKGQFAAPPLAVKVAAPPLAVKVESEENPPTAHGVNQGNQLPAALIDAEAQRKQEELEELKELRNQIMYLKNMQIGLERGRPGMDDPARLGVLKSIWSSMSGGFLLNSQSSIKEFKERLDGPHPPKRFLPVFQDTLATMQVLDRMLNIRNELSQGRSEVKKPTLNELQSEFAVKVQALSDWAEKNPIPSPVAAIPTPAPPPAASTPHPAGSIEPVNK